MKRALMIAAAFAASAALAQGYGPGSGKGPGMGMGKGPGMGFDGDNTRGWSMMSSQERSEHRDRMMSFKSYEECVAYLEQHHKAMEARASERGRPMPVKPAQNMCERMKQAGRFG